jgi:hypothetical protein
MTRDRVYLGSAPAEEDCAQVGADDYADRSIRECRAYIAAIKAVCGEPPEGATLRIVSEQHDYGSYREVVVEFDGNDEAAAKYASLCDEKAPTTWEAAGMQAPVAARGRGR